MRVPWSKSCADGHRPQRGAPRRASPRAAVSMGAPRPAKRLRLALRAAENPAVGAHDERGAALPRRRSAARSVQVGSVGAFRRERTEVAVGAGVGMLL
jgi:hypothetical protein